MARKLKRVPVTKLKASLSAYVRRMKVGESFVATNRGIAVAKLTPFEPEPDVKRVAVTELQAAHVRRAKLTGEGFVITSRGIAVAEFTLFTLDPEAKGT